MFSDRRWILHIYLILALSAARAQYAMYPPPMFAMPPPAPMALHVPVPVAAVAIPIPLPDAVDGQSPHSTTTTTTTTTTTERVINMAVPFHIPLPIQIAIPALTFPGFCQNRNHSRPSGCPPCPPCMCMPSCTPAFFSFCSPCHQKCRCRSKEDTPVPDRSNQNGPSGPQHPRPVPGPAFALPMGYPLPPPPMVMVPFPHPPPPIHIPSRHYQSRTRARARIKEIYSSDESSSSSCRSSEYSMTVVRRRNRRKKYEYNKRNWRRNSRKSIDNSDSGKVTDDTDEAIVKPVLSYISKDGNVQIQKKISNDEAAELLDDKSIQSVRISAEEDSDNKPRLLVTSQRRVRPMIKGSNRRVFMRGGPSNHVLGESKKEVVFRSPPDKQISNLTVSFQII